MNPESIPPERHAVRNAFGYSCALGLLLVSGLDLQYLNRSDFGATPYTDAVNVLRDGQWGYLPGSHREQDGSLTVRPTDFRIVAQDGSGGQANPPVNLYGTHLETEGDFSLNADIKRQSGTHVGLQLYGETPIIADEFRLNRSGVSLDITDTTLTVDRWDAPSIEPANSTKLTLPNSSELTLRIRRNGDRLIFSANDTEIGSLDDKGAFDTHEVWLGASALGAEWRLQDLTAQGEDGDQLRMVDTTQAGIVSKDGSRLQTLSSQGRTTLLVGTALALGPATGDQELRRIAFGGDFGVITTQNALKMQFRHPQPDVYDFREADALIDIAQKQGLKVHGHALVFGEANPRWLTGMPTDTPAQKQAVEKVMVDDITTTMEHEGDKLTSIDVVNEPLRADEPYLPGQELRNHIWEKAMGPGYIAKAFYTARAVKPQVALCINEYGLENDGPRWDAFYALVKSLKQQGVPVDCVGFQAHVYGADDKIDFDQLNNHMNALKALDIFSRISEMDVYADDGPRVQAEQFAGAFQLCLHNPACRSFTTWDVSDRYDVYIDDDGHVAWGHDYLWDDRLRPTDAYRRLLQIAR